MALLPRRAPAAVRAVAVPPAERRTAWATTASGEVVVATDQALLLPGGQRLPWAGVEHVTWRLPELTVTEVAEVQGAGAVHVLRLEDADGLPAEVRTRVTGSVAWSSHERLSPAGGVRVVGRRVPGAEVLTWQLVYDAGTDRGDPLVRAQAEALLEGARRTIG
ncbi:MAG TPA: hypothetical protein VFR07_06780 [Mycobacteriales bacterium]|jgi:hypothetical protein|nr:hypothetical protein [Mycobacteriales bacterium]